MYSGMDDGRADRQPVGTARQKLLDAAWKRKGNCDEPLQSCDQCTYNCDEQYIADVIFLPKAATAIAEKPRKG